MNRLADAPKPPPTTTTATIIRFEPVYDDGPRTILPVVVSNGASDGIILVRAPRSALNLLWSMADQYAGRSIKFSFEDVDLSTGRVWFRGVRILQSGR